MICILLNKYMIYRPYCMWSQPIPRLFSPSLVRCKGKGAQDLSSCILRIPLPLLACEDIGSFLEFQYLFWNVNGHVQLVRKIVRWKIKFTYIWPRTMIRFKMNYILYPDILSNLWAFLTLQWPKKYKDKDWWETCFQGADVKAIENEKFRAPGRIYFQEQL